MNQPFGIRLWVDTLVAVVTSAVLATLGWLVAAPMLAPLSAWLGIDQLVVLGPRDIVAHEASMAVAFGLPVAVGWLAALVDRFVARADPRPAKLALYVFLPFLAALCGFAKNLAWMKLALLGMSDVGGVSPSISLESLDLGWAPIRWTIAWGVVLCVFAGLLARRRVAAKRTATS